MKDFLLNQQQQKDIQGNSLLDNKFILILIIIDILAFFLMIIFFFINEILFWISFSFTIFLSVILTITIIIVLKKKINLIERLKKEEEEEEEIKLEEKEENNVISEKEKKKRDILLKNILQSQKDSRNNSTIKTYTKNEEIQKVNKTIEDMSIMGTIIKDQIIEEKKKNPEKFISIQDAVKTENKDNSLFIMGLLAQNLENQGITTAIEKEDNKHDENNDLASTTLQFMMNGLGTKKKYNLHFDLGDERNEQLLNDEKEQKDFNNKLKKKLAKEYNIREEDIIISFPQKGSYQITVIFKSNDFYNLNKNDLLKKFKDDPELGKLKDLHTGLIMEGCKIESSMFDSKGNNKDGGWGINETRGGKPYIHPEGWIRYGLKVLGKYDNGNNDWLACDNRPGEWCIAYHGVARFQESDDVKKAVGKIAKSNLKKGRGQDYRDSDDCMHKGQKVGVGVYCTPNPKVIDNYAGIAEVNEERYYMAFMLRVKPDKIRCAAEKKEYWVLNGTDDEIRPYGILIKKVE